MTDHIYDANQMKCEHCGHKLIKDQDGWFHKGENWFTPDFEICYLNQIADLKHELFEAKGRIYELEKICNNGP